MALQGTSSPTVMGRWIEGKWKPVALRLFFTLILFLVTCPLYGVIIFGVKDIPPRMGSIVPLPGEAGDPSLWAWIVTAAYVIWIMRVMEGQQWRGLVVSALGPLLQHDRMAAMGKGGSARFAGLIDEWSHPYKPGSVWLGRSLYDNGIVGYDDDRGLLTIASNRSGKGRSLIIPNLITWPGSVVVIDPKGTNAAVTAARRGKGGGRVTECLGQPVHVLDPFGIVAGIQTAAFNPLAAVDLKGNRAKEDIGLIADALVVPEGKGSSHWDEGARTILSGVIAHLLGVYASPLRIVDQPPKRMPSLVDVRAALRQDADGLDAMFGAMMQNPVAGGLAQAAAALIGTAGPNERGSLFTTTLRNTGWLDSVAMAKVLERSDFQMSDLKASPMSVYVVLPPDLLDEHSRFMRLFVNMAVRAAAQGGKSKVPILLVMDEFFSLGALGSLSKASGLLAGYGLKLWPILQNLTQLRELYPDNWQTFFANAGAVQIFGVNDRATAQEIVATLGQATRLEKVDERSMRVVSNLLEAPELEQLTERGTGLQVVLRSGKAPLLLRKSNYDQDEAFSKSMYAPDPDHPDS